MDVVRRETALVYLYVSVIVMVYPRQKEDPHRSAVRP
jgi:hypothetical protein